MWRPRGSPVLRGRRTCVWLRSGSCLEDYVLAPPSVLLQRADADPDDRRRVDALADRLDTVEVARTDGVEDVDRVLTNLDERTLVVCGGDGSLHVVVNRLHARGRLADARVAVFPVGTGNDLAHTLGLVDDVDAMAHLLTGGSVTPTDLLDLGHHGVAVNALHAGVGVDAAARSAELPDDLGAVAYPLGALLAGIGAEGFSGTVVVDGSPVDVADRAMLMVLVHNGRTIGGGHPLAPDADPHDGRLDVVVSLATGLAARAAFGLAIPRGTHLQRADVRATSGTNVTIRAPGLHYNVDGELWHDPIDELTVRVLPGALPLLLPSG